jgi:hypothetical protein
MEEEVKAVPEATPSHVNMHISSHKIGHPRFFLTNYPWEDTVDENITLRWFKEPVQVGLVIFTVVVAV